MTSDLAPDRAGGRLRAAWQALRSRASAHGTGAEMARARLMYERFREILANNDATLQLIAEIDERLTGRLPFALDSVVRQVRKAEMDVFVMAKNLNQLSGNAHAGLYPALRTLSAAIESACPTASQTAGQPPVVPLAEVRLEHAPLTGAKFARLGHARASGAAVPDGFVVTTAAFAAFMSENGLWARAEHLDDLIGARGGGGAVAAACREVEQAIRASRVPDAVAAALVEAFDRLAAGGDLRVSVRSSAAGEDGQASHAGQYRTVLGVDRGRLLDAYRSVVASAYGLAAALYRIEHGIGAHEAAMAVGCMPMIEPRCSGVVFTRRPDTPEADAVVVAAVPGLASGLVAGEQDSQVWVVGDGATTPASALLTEADLAGLSAAARQLESCLDGPQEVEWAIDATGSIVILQSRPLVPVPSAKIDVDGPVTDQPPVIAGGFTACPGVGAGQAVLVRSDDDLDRFPSRGVLVARQARPAFSRVLARCAAIVTDVGSPAGHMASLAREYGVPALVGCASATALLEPGEDVTVDATRREVFAGLHATRREASGPSVRPDAPAVQALRAIARLVTPLSLTDPAGPDFRPDRCRSLHDITRYVHEKAFEVMFQWGDVNWTDTPHARRLDVHLPLAIHVIDVGGGLREQRSHGEAEAALEDVVSVPFRALLAGMLDERIRWDRPRPLSARGFLAVVGERMAGLPGEALRVGGASYAIVSDRYLNFSTKAGYHFATIDTYCGESLNKNYIHFRFAGGAADGPRRERRVRFIASVLASLEFRVQSRADLLVARFEKYDEAALVARLQDMGRLCMCTRQLDMLMDSDASPDHFSRAFLAGRMDRF